jgi:hypothetical protein
MKIRTTIAILSIVTMAGMVPVANAQTASGNQTQQRIYGSQMMTQQEMNEYRERMRLAKTEAERERIRAEHHERMKERATTRGITLPDEPPAKAGSGGTMAPGSGMGPGGGMGSGGGGGGGGRR